MQELPKSRLRAQHAPRRPLRPGRPARRRAGHGASRPRLYRPHVLQGLFVIDVRDPKNPRAVNYLAAPPGTWNIHLQTHDDLLLVINAKDMFAAAEFADEKAYYKGQLGKVVGTAEAKSDRARLDRGACGLRHFQAGGAAPHRLHAGRRRRHPSRLVHRRALGLCLGADRRLHRLHLHHHRHERSGAAARGRPLLDPRHEPGRRRDAELAGHQPLRPAPRHRRTATPPTRPGATPAWW